LHFAFFGGNDSKIRVLDLSTCELLPGHLETSIKYIRSLQVCVKSNNQIYLAVSGCEPVYSKDKTYLFDLTNLLPNNLVIFQILNLEYLINDEETVLPQPSTVKSQAGKIKKLIQERDWYKAKFIEIRSKYNDLKERLDLLYKKKNKKSAVSYQTKIMQLQIK